MQIQYISLPKLKQEICRADLTGHQVFLCCIKCTRCKKAVTMTGLNPFDARCLYGYINGQVATTGRERSSETYLRIDLGETTVYASIRKTIHRGYTLTKCTRANWMSFDVNCTSCIDLAEFDHPQVHMEQVACW